MPLLSSTQIEALRSLEEEGMITDVMLKPKSQADNVYSDDESSWPTTANIVKGWLRTVPEGTIDVVSGVMADVALFRLLLPVGTAISNGDHVSIEGREYTVTDTNKESTYQLALRCSLRRVE